MRARELPPDRPIGSDGLHPAPFVRDDFTEEQVNEYLDSLRQGIGPQLAARGIGSTATQMRRYAQREPEFAKQIEEAMEEGGDFYRDRLRASARLLALNTENPTPRILEVELATHGGAEYSHLRRDRVKHEGHVTHGVTIDLDPAKLDALPPEKLLALREMLRELEEAVIEDAEFSEVKELNA